MYATLSLEAEVPTIATLTIFYAQKGPMLAPHQIKPINYRRHETREKQKQVCGVGFALNQYQNW